MSSFKEIYERIQQATSCRTQMRLAEALGIRQSSISDAKRRNSVPGDWYMKLFENFGLNPDWLKYGQGPMYLRTEQGYVAQDAPSAAGDAGVQSSDMIKSIICTFYDMPCRYDADGPQPELIPLGQIAVPAAFMADTWRVIRMNGDNMRQSVLPGAFFGVSRVRDVITSGAIYALFMPGEGLVLRRIFLNNAEDVCLLRSESPGFPETRLSPDLLQQRLLGRVVWTLQEL